MSAGMSEGLSHQWHHNIQNDDMRLKSFGVPYRLLAVRRLSANFPTFLIFKEVPNRFPNEDLIVNDENTNHEDPPFWAVAFMFQGMVTAQGAFSSASTNGISNTSKPVGLLLLHVNFILSTYLFGIDIQAGAESTRPSTTGIWDFSNECASLVSGFHFSAS